MIYISTANTTDDLQEVRKLFVEYQSSLGLSLCFQNFDDELTALPGDYAPPDGCLLIAVYQEEVAGCVALRKFVDGVCEMKRLYIRPQYRGLKIGKALAEAVIQYARRVGYARMRLDTLPKLKAALSLYRSLGFEEITPYHDYPMQAIFMELSLKVEYAAINTAAGVATLRDLTPDDIEHVVRFWYDSGDDFLDFLGIDRSRLGSRDDIRHRFTRAIRTGDPDQPSIAFAITVKGVYAGYTLLNRYAPDTNYSHWHITNPALRGIGLSTALYPYRIKTYFDLVPVNRLIHQTRTRNIAVNRMLDHWLPVAETRYIENPDGVALPGEFNLRYVFRSDVPGFLEKARAAANP